MSREIKISDTLSTTDMKEFRDKSIGRKSEKKATDDQFEAIEQGLQAIEDITNQTGNFKDLTPRKLKDFAKMTKNWLENHSSEIPGQDQGNQIKIRADDGGEITVDRTSINELNRLYQVVHDKFFKEFTPAKYTWGSNRAKKAQEVRDAVRDYLQYAQDNVKARIFPSDEALLQLLASLKLPAEKYRRDYEDEDPKSARRLAVSDEGVKETEASDLNRPGGLGVGGRSDTTQRGPKIELLRVGPAMEPALSEIYTSGNQAMEKYADRFKSAQKPHIEASQRAILETAKAASEARRNLGAQDQTAVIVGLGNGRDIPVLELAKMPFRYIIVFEADQQAVLKAIRKLVPENLHGKFVFIRADVTGISNEFCQNIRIAHDKYQEFPEKFRQELSHIVDNLKKKVSGGPPNIGDGHTFLSTHLVPSQLGSEVDDYIKKTLNLSPEIAQEWNDFYYRSKEFKSLRKLLVERHLRWAGRSADTVHFADTYMVKRDLDSAAEREAIILHDEDIDPVLNETFERVGQPREWKFDQIPTKFKPPEHEFNSVQFLVKSFSLRRKPSG